MADKVTTTNTDADKAAEDRKKALKAINDKLDEARQLMVESGMPAGTADAMLNAARPNDPSAGVVGNLADLQRMGAIVQTGIMPTPPEVEDLETDDIKDAFAESPNTNPTTTPEDDRLAFALKPPNDADAATAASDRSSKAAEKKAADA